MHALTTLLKVALLGLFCTLCQQQAGRAIESDTQESSKTVTVDVVGVYMQVDVDHIRETVEAQCEGTSRFKRSCASGNRMTVELSFVPDIEAFARKITFGKVIGVEGQTIKVEYTEAGQIEPRPGQREEQPEDPLGPAMEERNGDLVAALRSIGAFVSLGEAKISESVTNTRHEHGDHRIGGFLGPALRAAFRNRDHRRCSGDSPTAA